MNSALARFSDYQANSVLTKEEVDQVLHSISPRFGPSFTAGAILWYIRRKSGDRMECVNKARWFWKYLCENSSNDIAWKRAKQKLMPALTVFELEILQANND
jgi:hypothetical protein